MIIDKEYLLIYKIYLSYSMEKEQYTKANQESFRKAKRRNVSRPHELSPIGDYLHQRVTNAFDLEDAQKPIVVWSVLFDKPNTPSSKFVYAERYPEDVEEKDKANFSSGITRITEYATNYATREFFERNINSSIGRVLARGYGMFAEPLTYGLLYRGTYKEMGKVKKSADSQGKDYKEALLQGLFEHDHDPLNNIIKDAKIPNVENLNQLATRIGERKFKKPDIGKILNKLEIERTDSETVANLKNCAVSVLAAGVFRTPGVIEISAGIATIPVIENMGFAAIAIANDIDPLPLAGSAFLGTVAGLSVTPFASIHEVIHHYSASEQYMGFIPARLIEKNVTPYLTRLEPEI